MTFWSAYKQSRQAGLSRFESLSIALSDDRDVAFKIGRAHV
jgi:hypothetical protein